MTNIEYFKYCLNTDNVLKLSWYYSILGVRPKNSPFVEIRNDKYFVKINDDFVQIDNVDIDKPLIRYSDPITLTNNEMINIKDSIETTIGRAICNRVLLVHPFKDKIEYINKTLSADLLQDTIIKKLLSKEIEIKEYVMFVNSTLFLQSLSKLITIAATEKNITAAPGILEYKKKLLKEYDDTYGKKWRKDKVRIVEYLEKLKDFDKEYLADDPTLGKTLTKKIQNNARLKQYISFGNVEDFGDNEFIFESLIEEMDKNPETLKTIFNSIRQGSFSRGHETQKGGAVAKSLLRAASGVVVKEGDCGSNMYKEITIDKNNASYLNNRYYIENNTIKKLENGEELIGKTLKFRSPLYCKNPNRTFCTTCCGDNFLNRENSVGLQLINISTAILTTALKSMHDTTIKVVNVDINEIIY